MIYSIIIILIIVLIKAIFSAADTAFTYINRAEIIQLSKKDKKAKEILVLMEDTNKFFGIIEVVINMCELLASAVASISVLEALMAYFEKLEISTHISILLSVIIVTVVLSYIMLVFGGILPKRIARNHPKKTAYSLIPILWIVAKLNYPFERIINFSTNLFSRLFNIKIEPEEKMTEKQLKMIIKEAKEEGVLESIEKRIFINTLKANNTRIHKIMVPIEDAYLININREVSDIIKEIKNAKFTRIPIFEDRKTNIIGIFNIKSIITEYTAGELKEKDQIRKVLKEPIYINENEKLFTALKTLQSKTQMIGIVVDKEGKNIGIVTIEDIIEELVGEIYDEDDKIERK